MTRLAKALRFFEKRGLSLLAISKKMHIDRIVLRREFKKHYGDEAFQLMQRERQKKWYRQAKLEAIAAEIDRGELCLRKIAKKFYTHHTVLYCNMERYYGLQWAAIFERYRSKRGLQKGHSFGRATQYKKGTLRGIAARNWKPIGAIQFKKYYCGQHRKQYCMVKFIKVTDVPCGHNWMVYARWLWTQKCGIISKGKFVIHLDDNRANDSFDNLALMTRAEHAQYRDAAFPEKLELRKQRMTQAIKQRIRIPIGYNSRWECPECAGEFKRRLERCPKCGSHSVRRMKVRVA